MAAPVCSDQQWRGACLETLFILWTQEYHHYQKELEDG
jgi:hypothetical protein